MISTSESKENKQMYNILVCDDEKDIVSALTIYFSGASRCIWCCWIS